MGRMTRGVGTALLTLAVVLAGAPAADARPLHDTGPGQVRGFPITVDTTVPAGGRAWVGSPSLPTRARAIEVSISAAGGTEAFTRLYTVLSGMTNKNRLLYCAAIGFANTGFTDAPALSLVGASDRMQACFGVVTLLTSGRAVTKGGSLRVRCPQTLISVPVRVDSTGVTATGQPAASRRPPLRIRCAITGDTLAMTVSTRSKRASLRAIVGERLTIGFASAPGASGDTALTLTYGKPR